MKLRFVTLCSLAFQHPYYADGICRDIEVLVTPQSRALLGAGRLVARQLDGRLHLLFEARDDGTPVVMPADKQLYAGLALSNPHFDNFTLPVLADPQATPLWANATSPSALDAARAVTLAAGIYQAPLQQVQRPVTVSLRTPAGDTVTTHSVTGPNDSLALDLRALPPGEYSVHEDYGAAGTRTRELLVHPDLHAAGVFGVVALRLDPSLYAAPAAFSMAFAPRSQVLKYYVVARDFGPAEFDQLGVTDQGFGDDARSEVGFDKVPSTDFSSNDITPALLAPGGERIVMFRSQAPVARRERGLRKIQLSRNGDVLVEHLPQAGAQQPQPQFVVHLSKP